MDGHDQKCPNNKFRLPIPNKPHLLPTASSSSSHLRRFVDETNWYNALVLGTLLPASLWSPLPHFASAWLHNYVGGLLLYFVSDFLWCIYIYYWKH